MGGSGGQGVDAVKKEVDAGMRDAGRDVDGVMREVEHVQQRHSWDCGLACVMMVMPKPQRDSLAQTLYQVCQEEGFDKSTWSIDLAYLLRRFGVRHRYRTVTLGVDPGFKAETFYDHVLTKDAQRVVDRFVKAGEAGVVVEQGGTSTSELLHHLLHHGPVILLTNAHLLVCHRCERALPLVRSCLPCSPPYQGHYVLLVGFEGRKGLVYYRNPSFRNRVCAISFSQLDDARLSYGTDEDVIYIYTNTSKHHT